MVLPRFARLPAERRAHILAVAREHLAQGADAASYNQVIADAGISKTSAYLYFDGKADLVAEIRRDLFERLARLLGSWQPARSVAHFWRQLEQQSGKLQQHLAASQVDLALLIELGQSDESEPFAAWFAGLVDDGGRLGLIRSDIDRSLMLTATKALFRCLDEHAIAALARGDPINSNPSFRLLRGLWSAPTRATKPRATKPRATKPRGAG